MSARVLIVDEAAGVRSLFARILGSLDCVMVEALDGGAALEMLEQGDFRVAIFDMDTPLLTGIELLQAVRTSSRYSMLPVVMITDGADLNRVAEAVKHGASECLTRPFDLERIRTRIERLIKVVPQASRGAGADAKGTPDAMPSVLIVDRNAEFRHFASNVLMSTYSTMQAKDGVQALRICELRPQSVLVLGEETGMPAPHVIARRLKGNPALAGMRIVLVTSKATAGDVVDPTAFDAILTRTFVPAEFAEQFHQALASLTTADAGSAAGDAEQFQPALAGPTTADTGSVAAGGGVFDDVRQSVVSATEQVLGMMASASVALVNDGSAPVPPPEFEAATVMTMDGHGVAVRIAVRCDLPTASRLGARMTGLPESEIAVEDAQSGLGEIVNVIGGRVKAAVTRAGASASYTIPEARAFNPSAAPATDVALQFASSDGQLSLGLVLTAVNIGAPAEARPAS